jgi:hypothetical protein
MLLAQARVADTFSRPTTSWRAFCGRGCLGCARPGTPPSPPVRHRIGELQPDVFWRRGGLLRHKGTGVRHHRAEAWRTGCGWCCAAEGSSIATPIVHRSLGSCAPRSTSAASQKTQTIDTPGLHARRREAAAQPITRSSPQGTAPMNEPDASPAAPPPTPMASRPPDHDGGWRRRAPKETLSASSASASHGWLRAG